MSDNEDVRTYRGVSYVELPTAWEVTVGDRIVCMLADDVAAVEVTSITYRELDLTAHGLDRSVTVVFGYQTAPWWVDELMMTADITLPVCVAAPRPEAPTPDWDAADEGDTRVRPARAAGTW